VNHPPGAQWRADGDLRRRAAAGPRLAALVLGMALAGLGLGGRVAAQPPLPTPAPGAPTPAGPPPDLGGEWSITRTWYRGCPGCGWPMVRTTRWVILQRGAEVRVDRGPRGIVTGDAVGGGTLALAGPETGGFDVQRFWYGTLFVRPGGNTFEGGFGGSESIANPCGDRPPQVTCFVSAGWLRAVRVSPVATMPAPPGPPTAAPAPTITPSPTAQAPFSVATHVPVRGVSVP